MCKGELDDSKSITRDALSTRHWGNGDYEIQTNNDDDLEYILILVNQSIKKNKNNEMPTKAIRNLGNMLILNIIALNKISSTLNINRFRIPNYA